MNTSLPDIIRERYGMSVTQFCGNHLICVSTLYGQFKRQHYDFDRAVAAARAAYVRARTNPDHKESA